MQRRVLPLLLVTAATIVVAACNSAMTELKSVPYGFVTVSARKQGSSYTASPVATFYDASGLSVPTATDPWDSCRVQSYSRAAGTSLGAVFPSMSAGSAIPFRLGTRTDSLFPVTVGPETQYRVRSASGVPYTPGDSISVTIPGAAYPALSFKARTAEAFAVDSFGMPTVGQRIDLRWTKGADFNNTMVFAFRYAGVGADTLNTQVYCQFKDDGADSIPARLVSAWVSSPVRGWAAARVRTYVSAVSKGGYFDFISTFDVPTPVVP